MYIILYQSIEAVASTTIGLRLNVPQVAMKDETPLSYKDGLLLVMHLAGKP